MTTTMIVSVISLAVALYALWLSLQHNLSGPRFRVEASRSRSLDSEGKERVSYSLSYSHDGSFIGKTLCRFYVARATRRQDKQRRSESQT
jgi:hypothetical protein